jgi:hypothetical protein
MPEAVLRFVDNGCNRFLARSSCLNSREFGEAAVPTFDGEDRLESEFPQKGRITDGKCRTSPCEQAFLFARLQRQPFF